MTKLTNHPDYTVSEWGIVTSLKFGKERVLKQSEGLGGRRVNIGGKLTSVHHLVAEAFIPNPLNHPYVRHKDGNPNHNWVGNLEWSSGNLFSRKG